MRKWPLIVVVALGCLLVELLPTSAQSSDWQEAWQMTCPSPNGDYTRGGVFPRYEYQNRRLVLVDILNGHVTKEVETSMHAAIFRFVGWSPDCRYLIGGLEEQWKDKTVIWDMTTSGHVAEYAGFSFTTPSVFWHPSGRYAAVNANSAHLFDAVTGNSLQLTEVAMSYGTRFEFVHWDDTRHQLIAAQRNEDVVIFDIETGQVVSYFHNTDHFGDPAFVMSDDNSKIIVFTVGSGQYLEVGDRDTHTQIQLEMSPDSVVYADSVILSPTNRYLVIVGPYIIRVWDLQNLAPDRRPMRFFTYVLPWWFHFYDEDHVEISDYRNGGGDLWNIHTGERTDLPQTQEQMNHDGG